MKKRTYLYALLSVVSLVSGKMACAMESSQKDQGGGRLAPFACDVAVGSATGVAEVVVDQPLIYFKNMLQQYKKIARDPRIWYRGFRVNVACMAPTTAVQVATDNALKQVLPGDQYKEAIARSFGAGVLSSLVSNPTELVILHQQNTGKTARKTIEQLIASNGYRVLACGMSAKALRDGGFGVGFLSLYPMVENALLDATDSKLLAKVGATVIAGTGTAVATHPFDTISTVMQTYPEQKRSMYQIAHIIYAHNGMRGFYKGLVPRGTRVALAIGIMNNVKSVLTD